MFKSYTNLFALLLSISYRFLACYFYIFFIEIFPTLKIKKKEQGNCGYFRLLQSDHRILKHISFKVRILKHQSYIFCCRINFLHYLKKSTPMRDIVNF